MTKESKPEVNASASIREVPIACRFPEDRIDMLDALTKQRGFQSRSEAMRELLNDGIDRHFGGRAA